MFTLMMYAICLCLFFKGVQILQIALVSTGPWRVAAMKVGVISLALTTICATLLATWFTLKSWDFDRALLRILTGPPQIYR